MFDERQIDDALHVARDSLNTGAKTLTLEDALQEATASNEVVQGARRRASQVSRQGSLFPIDRRSSTHLLPPTSTSSITDGQLEPSRVAGRGPSATVRMGEEDPHVGIGTKIRHQSSAISLINRKESIKSVPETSTTQTNVLGEVEAPYPGAAPSRAMPHITETLKPTDKRKIHSYMGNDPTVKKMLDNMYVDNFPYDIVEFGPPVAPIHRIKSKAGVSTKEAWRPEGYVVAAFAEHRGPINRIVVSPDHMFFITGGHDGMVKVWDTSRLEKNPAYRSRQTHRHPAGAKVLALCFIESTHTFVSCGDDGSVHVVKVDCASDGRMARYSRTRLLREYQLPSEEYAVWCEHFKAESGKSVLLLATNLSRVVAVDLTDMSIMFTLENPVHHGTPTCFCLDKRRNWLLLGTSHGVLDLWDLRFRVRLKGWGVPGKGAIYRLSVHPSKGKGKWVCCAGGTRQGEVTVWDLEKGIVREVYRVVGQSTTLAPGTGKSTPASTSGNSAKDGTPRKASAYDAWDVDNDKPEGMLGQFATAIEPGAHSSTDKGVRAMAVGFSIDDMREVRNSYIITGGSDKKMRFWDLAQIEKSLVYSGLGHEEGKMAYTHYQLTTTMTLVVERAPKSEGAGGTGGVANCRGAGVGKSGGGREGGGNELRKSGRPSRSSVISLQQQNLLNSHLDFVMDVAVIESPYQMVVSVDRSGVVYVFS